MPSCPTPSDDRLTPDPDSDLDADIDPHIDSGIAPVIDPGSAVDPGPARVVLRGPGDLIAALPYLIGVRPGPGDLAVVAHRDRRVSAVVVVTLGADPLDPDAAAALRHLVAGLDADAVDLVAYTSTTIGLFDLAEALPVPVLEVLRVHRGRWWSLTCPDPDCCPPGATALTEPDPDLIAPFIAPFIATGGAPLPERRMLPDCLRPGPQEVVAQVAACLRQRDQAPQSEQPTTTSRRRLLQQARGERTGGPRDLGVAQAADLLQALQDVTVRDGCVSWHDDAAWWLWLDLMPYAPPGWIAPVATLIATTAYQRGDGLMGRLGAEYALADDPGYTLARQVRVAIGTGVHPAAFSQAVAEAAAEQNAAEAVVHGRALAEDVGPDADT